MNARTLHSCIRECTIISRLLEQGPKPYLSALLSSYFWVLAVAESSEISIPICLLLWNCISLIPIALPTLPFSNLSPVAASTIFAFQFDATHPFPFSLTMVLPRHHRNQNPQFHQNTLLPSELHRFLILRFSSLSGILPNATSSCSKSLLARYNFSFSS